MDEADLSRVSKRLSWLLRHGAVQETLEMDEAGWAALSDVRGWLGADATWLSEVVRRNNKARFQQDGQRIRASQGHSTDGAPVTLEALEASWSPWTGQEPLWHGTTIEAAAGIAAQGILPVARTHVHLAPSAESRVGKRAGVHVLLEVSPARLRGAGQGIFVSPNGVVLVRQVPPACLVAVHPQTKRARREIARLRALFPGG